MNKEYGVCIWREWPYREPPLIRSTYPLHLTEIGWSRFRGRGIAGGGVADGAPSTDK